MNQKMICLGVIVAGLFLTYTARDVSAGTLALPAGMTVNIVGADGVLSLTSEAGAVTLAPGQYELRQATMILTDSGNRTWKIESNRWSGEPFEIKQGKPTNLSIGPPFIIRTRASRNRVQPGENVRFGMEITDAMGRPYRTPSVNRRRPAKPGFRLLDSAGKEISAFTFEYG